MFTGQQICTALKRLGFTHVVWLPDSALGAWEEDLESDPELQLVRVSREGEAWQIAAGLLVGGKRPMVMIQCTGLFESGDAMRNVLFDMQLPLCALIGYRSYLSENSSDSARRFTEPVLKAWDLDYLLIDAPEKLPQWEEHLRRCAAANRPAFALLAEGRM